MNTTHMEKENGGESLRFLAFTLAKEQYAIPLLKVREVIAPSDTTSIPYTPSYYRGIMNLRGQLVSVIDLQRKLGMPESGANPESAIIILDLDGISIGVMVDSIDSVLGLTETDIKPRPEIEHDGTQDFISGVAHKGKKLVLLLDIEKVIDKKDLNIMQHSQAV